MIEKVRDIVKSQCEEDDWNYHILIVIKYARLLARKLNVNEDIAELGALLHDIGRSRTHSVHHAVVGAEIARAAGLPDSLISIIKTHIGGGIETTEAEELAWPKGDVYIPVTLEEKIVSYADKLIEGSRRAPITKTVEQLNRNLKPEAAERVRKINEEITALVGDKHD